VKKKEERKKLRERRLADTSELTNKKKTRKRNGGD